MDPQQWAKFISDHDGIVGSTVIQTPAEQSGRATPNPHPPIKITFQNGTTMTVSFNGDGSVNINDPGTAYKASPTDKPPTAVTGPDKSKYIWNPTGGASGTGAFEPAPGMPAGTPPAPTVTTRLVNGTLYQWSSATGDWAPASGVPAGTAKQVPGRTVKGDDGTIYTVGTDGITLTEAVKGQNLGKQNAATAQGRLGVAQQNADTNALKASYQQKIDQAKQDYLDGKLSLAEFQAQATELHQQATEALTARAQDLNAATTMARDQATADATWASTSVPAGGNQALVDVLNKEGAPVGITLPKAQPTPYPRPDVNAMVAQSLAKLGIAAPWSGSGQGGNAAPATNGASAPAGNATPFVAPAFSASRTGFQVPTPPPPASATPAVTVGATQGITPTSPGMPSVTPGPRFGVTGPQ